MYTTHPSSCLRNQTFKIFPRGRRYAWACKGRNRKPTTRCIGHILMCQGFGTRSLDACKEDYYLYTLACGHDFWPHQGFHKGFSAGREALLSLTPHIQHNVAILIGTAHSSLVGKTATGEGSVFWPADFSMCCPTNTWRYTYCMLMF